MGLADTQRNHLLRHVKRLADYMDGYTGPGAIMLQGQIQLEKEAAICAEKAQRPTLPIRYLPDWQIRKYVTEEQH